MSTSYKDKKIYIASDHAGFSLKQKLIEHYDGLMDLGTISEDSVDYPDFAAKLVAAVTADKEAMGVLICGSGQGVSIRANRHNDIRAALCWLPEIAELSRQHNDANVLSLPARFVETEQAYSIFETFFSTDFEGGRHARRIEKLHT